MRVGLVSPYPWDVPGGVVAHIADLAEALIARGHDASVLTPVDDDELPLPSYVTRAGRSVPIPYNGSVSRLLIGPVSAARARRWMHEGRFDILHVHSPETFSLSLAALGNAKGPIVATFHAANPKSRILAMMQQPLRLYLERLSGAISVSAAARKTIVEHLGNDSVVVPNGVHIAKFAGAVPLAGWPGDGGAVGFVGRVDEPRKGLQVLFDAWPLVRRDHPAARLLVAGPGVYDGTMPEGVTMLGRISDAAKARALASVDVFAAPHIGGESFGIVLLEAMAAGAPIVASDLDAFTRVLEHGRLAALATVGDPSAFAAQCSALLASPTRREELRTAARHAVARYDWSVVAGEILRVYETAIAANTGRVVATPDVVEVDLVPHELDQSLGSNLERRRVVVVVAVLCIAAVLGLYLIGTAQRLDRLHARVDAAAAAFDAQLRRRSVAAGSFANVDGLDPAVRDALRDAEREAHAATGLGPDREVAEHAVTRSLGWIVAKSPETLTSRSAAAIDLHDDALRASFARSFYNDTVRDALVVRDRRIVRWLGLAGRAPHPSYFEMDDEELPISTV